METSNTQYQLPEFDFVPPPELAGGAPRRYPLAIVGAGLAGLTLAADLASRGVACVVLDEDSTVGVRGASSRGIAYMQKTLEVMA
ncbi:MAG: FAD-dependent oxidoreductase, partial [Comamonadaceae bacterium]